MFPGGSSSSAGQSIGFSQQATSASEPMRDGRTFETALHSIALQRDPYVTWTKFTRLH